MNTKEMHDNADFVYQNSDFECKVEFDLNTKKYKMDIIVSKNGTMRKYPPVWFIDLVIFAYYIKIEQLKKVGDKLRLAYTCKGEITHLISRFEYEVENCNPKLEYDYSKCYIALNSSIEKLKADFDVYKYELEVRKLKIETSWYFLFAIIAVIVSLYKCKN